MKIKVYIAGPMSGYWQFNFPAFNAAAGYLRDKGYHVFNPAEMDVIFEATKIEDLEVLDQKEFLSPSAIRRFVRRDLHIICNELHVENKDMIVTLPKWESSKGACAEVAVARWLGLSVISGASIVGNT